MYGDWRGCDVLLHTLTDVPANLDKLVHVHLHNVIPLVLFQMGAVIH